MYIFALVNWKNWNWLEPIHLLQICKYYISKKKWMCKKSIHTIEIIRTYLTTSLTINGLNNKQLVGYNNFSTNTCIHHKNCFLPFVIDLLIARKYHVNIAETKATTKCYKWNTKLCNFHWIEQFTRFGISLYNHTIEGVALIYNKLLSYRPH